MSLSSAGSASTPSAATTAHLQTLAPLASSTLTNQYLPGKRAHSSQSSLATGSFDLRELTATLHELNQHFKKQFKVLTEIKDQIGKVSEKQETRPVDDNLGIHKLERVGRRRARLICRGTRFR